MRTIVRERGRERLVLVLGLGEADPPSVGRDWGGRELWRDTSLRRKDKMGVQMELLQTRESGIHCQITL